MDCDVIVIGGGPAGMMAAGRAAEQGARVVLLEKNTSLGVKLLITGGGRSNVTNAEFDEHIFLAKFGVAGTFLYSPLSQRSGCFQFRTVRSQCGTRSSSICERAM